ncbi:hypothetical protein Q4S25_09705 [Morganella morganii]
MMNTYKKWLSFVLVDDNSFSELLTKIERSFKQRLSCEDDEGRYIATAKFDGFKIKVIDKIDRLSELLCDDNYTLEITIYTEEYFNSSFENYIKEILNSNGLQWERSVWAPTQPI